MEGHIPAAGELHECLDGGLAKFRDPPQRDFVLTKQL
jgi:hypothetical protein